MLLMEHTGRILSSILLFRLQTSKFQNNYVGSESLLLPTYRGKFWVDFLINPPHAFRIFDQHAEPIPKPSLEFVSFSLLLRRLRSYKPHHFRCAQVKVDIIIAFPILLPSEINPIKP